MGLQHVHWWKRWENDYLKTNIVPHKVEHVMFLFTQHRQLFVLLLQFDHLAGCAFPEDVQTKQEHEVTACSLECTTFTFSLSAPHCFRFQFESCWLKRRLASHTFFACLHSPFDQTFVRFKTATTTWKDTERQRETKVKQNKNDSRRLNYQQWSRRKERSCWGVTRSSSIISQSKHLLHQAAARWARERERETQFLSIKQSEEDKKSRKSGIRNKIKYCSRLETFDVSRMISLFVACTSTQNASTHN